MSGESNWGPHDTVNPRDVWYVGSGSVWEKGEIVSTIVQVSFPAGATSTLPARTDAIDRNAMAPWLPLLNIAEVAVVPPSQFVPPVPKLYSNVYAAMSVTPTSGAHV